jgi:hypothetical protein
LQINSSRPFKLASKTLTSTVTGDDTTRSDTLDLVFAVPCNKVAIIFVFFLSFHTLYFISISKIVAILKKKKKKKKDEPTYIFLDDSPKALHPEESDSSDLVDKQPFTRKERFTKTLRLVLALDSIGTSHKSISTNLPLVAAVHAEDNKVSKYGGGKEELARSSVL